MLLPVSEHDPQQCTCIKCVCSIIGCKKPRDHGRRLVIKKLGLVALIPVCDWHNDILGEDDA